MNIRTTFPVQTEGETATVFAGDYLNKLSGEAVERECKLQIDVGCKNIVVNFAETNSLTASAFRFF